MTMIVNIVIGLIGLGIVIMAHEAGHFIAAKRAGIQVDAFSIGWGKPLFRKKIGETEYRISMIPMGGYCKMKGENALKIAWEEKMDTLPKEKGDFFAASPLKRIFVALSGPLANLLFAVIVLSILWGVGFTYQTYENRVVNVSDYQLPGTKATYPADKAGIQTGDRIISIEGKEVNHYRDIQEAVAPAGGKTLEFVLKRENQTIQTTITPLLDKQSGVGKIGVYAWIDPIIGEVKENSPAARAGLQKGDRVLRVEGEKVSHSIDFSEVLAGDPEKIDIRFLRSGTEQSTTLVPHYTEEGTAELGFSFENITVNTPDYNIFQALGQGVRETVNTLGLTLRGIGLLFSGINVTEAVSGPIKISYYMGEITTAGFKVGVGTGITSLLQFLSFISVAVFIMNLLPIPLLDGGLVLLYAVEGIIQKPLKPVVIYRYQTIGMMLVFGIIVFALFNDVLFLFNQ